jgi:SanA protein
VPVLVIGANLWIASSARPYLYTAAHELPAKPVVIVPGTLVEHGIPHKVLVERLAAALTLYKAGKAGRILVSGNRRDAHYDEVAVMHRWLTRRGVPEADILDDPAGYRTLDTMQRAARVFGVTSAIVCSQGANLPRAVYLARHAGIDAVGLVVDPKRRKHVLSIPHETMGSALAMVDTAIGRRARVLTAPQDMRTTAALR